MRLNSERSKNVFICLEMEIIIHVSEHIEVKHGYCLCLDFCRRTTRGARYPELYPAVAMLLDFSVNMVTKNNSILQ